MTDDCCYNCIEGVEPCCDEIVNSVESTVENSKYDIRFLASLTCCPPKFHPIYMTMATLSDDELRVFRDELRSFSGNGRTHEILENEFTDRLGD